ncbi:MAG: glycosyltransferase [Treponema sp.]|nr:glycosyltransferase [Treponema sp.]
MPRLLQINSVVNSGSTGHIAENIGKYILANGWESYIAYGRNPRPSASKLIRIGTKFDVLFHVLVTRLFDLHGLASRRATKKLVDDIKRIKPDIIHLHNIHGYYLNYKILFSYLAESKVPVVWTMHDCWAATGHCPYYTFVQCIVWTTKDGCRKCPQKKSYPKSMLFSAAAYNFKCKKKYFNLLDKNQLTIVCPSKWLADELGKSYLAQYRRFVIHNGIDFNVFQPMNNLIDSTAKVFNKKIILGVASVWDHRKGLEDFVKLADILDDDMEIVLVGVSSKQQQDLPRKIVGIQRTENQQELARLYSQALVFVNPTYEDTFPTTNLESLACGTPVITYRTGGSPEAIDENTGYIVEVGNVYGIKDAIKKIDSLGKKYFAEHCIKRAKKLFQKEIFTEKYLKLYQSTSDNNG